MAASFTDIPDPLEDLDAVNKRYCDDNSGGGGGGGSGGFRGVNHQTGATYYVLPAADKEKLITLNRATAVSVVLPATSETEQVADFYDEDVSAYEYTANLCTEVTPGALGWDKVGQSFTCAVTGFITRARFYLKRVGSPTGNATAKLYEHTGTYGGSSGPGTLLATSDNLDVTTVSTTGAFYDLAFSTSYELTAGVHYIISIEYGGSSSVSNCIRPADSLLAGHSGVPGFHIFGSSVWDMGVPAPNKDFIFYVYVTGPPTMDDKWVAYFENLGAGPVTISTVDSAIDGLTSVGLNKDTGIIIACDGSSYYTCRGLGLGALTPFTVTTTNFSTTSTTLVDVTGLAFAAAASKLYEVEATLLLFSSDVNGGNVDLRYTGTLINSANVAQILGMTSTGINGVVISSPINGGGAGPWGTTASYDFVLKIWAIIRTSTSGIIKIQVKKNTSGTFYVLTGRMSVTKLA